MCVWASNSGPKAGDAATRSHLQANGRTDEAMVQLLSTSACMAGLGLEYWPSFSPGSGFGFLRHDTRASSVPVPSRSSLILGFRAFEVGAI
ncbi:hypothetical protein ACLOJK_021690 [Asimina triloba]